MTKNADNSKGYQRSATHKVHANSREERDHVPNAVPIEFGTALNRKSMRSPHKSKASISGIRGRGMTTTGLEKDETSDIVNLANAMAPRNAVIILFPKVIAYILARNSVSELSDRGECNIP
jgi:glycine/serine hydroxymethyltransferase